MQRRFTRFSGISEQEPRTTRARPQKAVRFGTAVRTSACRSGIRPSAGRAADRRGELSSRAGAASSSTAAVVIFGGASAV